MIQSFLRTALRDGFFHADMHQGNLFVDREGRIVAVDFGIMGRLGRKERRFLAEILYGFIRRDYLRVAEVHFEAGYVPHAYRVEDFAQALRAIGEPIHSRTADQISMAKLLTLLFEITSLFDMTTRIELVMLQKTMVVVEGVARKLDPQLNMWSTAEPVVRRLDRGEPRPGRADRRRRPDAFIPRRLPCRRAAAPWSKSPTGLRRGLRPTAKRNLPNRPRTHPATWVYLCFNWLFTGGSVSSRSTVGWRRTRGFLGARLSSIDAKPRSVTARPAAIKDDASRHDWQSPNGPATLARREYHNCDNCHFLNVRAFLWYQPVALRWLTQRTGGGPG